MVGVFDSVVGGRNDNMLVDFVVSRSGITVGVEGIELLVDIMVGATVGSEFVPC